MVVMFEQVSMVMSDGIMVVEPENGEMNLVIYGLNYFSGK